MESLTQYIPDEFSMLRFGKKIRRNSFKIAYRKKQLWFILTVILGQEKQR